MERTGHAGRGWSAVKPRAPGNDPWPSRASQTSPACALAGLQGNCSSPAAMATANTIGRFS